MIEAAKKRVPAWALPVVFAAGIVLGAVSYWLRDYWRVPVCAALIMAAAHLAFGKKRKRRKRALTKTRKRRIL